MAAAGYGDRVGRVAIHQVDHVEVENAGGGVVEHVAGVGLFAEVGKVEVGVRFLIRGDLGSEANSEIDVVSEPVDLDDQLPDAGGDVDGVGVVGELALGVGEGVLETAADRYGSVAPTRLALCQGRGERKRQTQEGDQD